MFYWYIHKKLRKSSVCKVLVFLNVGFGKVLTVVNFGQMLANGYTFLYAYIIEKRSYYDHTKFSKRLFFQPISESCFERKKFYNE